MAERKTQRPARMTDEQRRDDDRARRAAALTARDFPLLPTSDTDARPSTGDGPVDNLTPGQRLAVAAIVSGETFAAAARAANVTPRTLYTWRREPAFRRAVERLSRETLDVVMIRARNLMLRATRVLGDALLEAGREEGAKHAMRVINSGRLWTVLREPPPDDLAEEAVDDAATVKAEALEATPPTEAVVEEASADNADARNTAAEAATEVTAEAATDAEARTPADEHPPESNVVSSIDDSLRYHHRGGAVRRPNADGTARAVPFAIGMSG